MRVFVIGHMVPWEIPFFFANNFKRLGHTVGTYDYVANPTHVFGKLPITSLPSVYPRLQRMGFRNPDTLLKSEVKKFKPDLVLVVKGESILNETIEWIRKETGAAVVNMAPDDPQLFNALSKHVAPAYDYVFTASTDSVKSYHDIGVKAEWIGYACEPSVHRTMKVSAEDRKVLGSDICFAGSCYPERVVLLSALRDYDLKIWGSRWTRQNAMMKTFFRLMKMDEYRGSFNFGDSARTVMTTDIWKKCTGRGAYGNDLLKAFNSSKIIINIHHVLMRDGGTQGNLRVFEATGCGSFLLNDLPKGIEKMFKLDREIVCFRDGKDMADKADYYLNNPEERDKIAARGQRRAYGEHTYMHRTRQILKTVKKIS
ncbi:MAG: glycosyltransferase [Candidatus Aenigmarchaeota archaeon]|nr:glycosyltransferase [Candidatus Aenigmarchaeota archaeon]